MRIILREFQFGAAEKCILIKSRFVSFHSGQYKSCALIGYVGNSDWVAYVKDVQVGNMTRRYLYANGKPLRVDLLDAWGTPSYYSRYTARGDANFLQHNGDGGTSWFWYGAW